MMLGADESAWAFDGYNVSFSTFKQLAISKLKLKYCKSWKYFRIQIDL